MIEEAEDVAKVFFCRVAHFDLGIESNEETSFLNVIEVGIVYFGGSRRLWHFGPGVFGNRSSYLPAQVMLSEDG